MTETLFAFNERNYLDCQSAYRGNRNQEYYLGDYTIEAGSVIDVRAERKAVGPSSIVCLQSRTRLSFSRSWSHIRDDATDVIVLWFVKRGYLRISHHGECRVARPGDFAITRSMTPFSIQCETDKEDRHEVLHVIIPAHDFRRFMPHEVKAGYTVSRNGREFDVAEHVLTDLFEDAGDLSESTQQLLLDGALSALAEAIRGREDCLQVRQSLREKRLQEILRYIDVHLTDPNLSASAVASACGISSRYLSSLLKDNQTPFLELIWDKRVKTASRWLATTDSHEISIAEIAFRVGFKSPAHFSRMFKRKFGQGPREFRTGCREKLRTESKYEADAQALYFSASGTNTLQ